MLRAVTPADLPSLLLFQRRAIANEARCWHRLASGRDGLMPLSTTISEWLPARSIHHTWVLTQLQLVAGIASCHERSGPSSWELGWLQVARGQESHVTTLLEGICQQMGRMGGERLFLRLTANSALTEDVQRAGFLRYADEELFIRPKGAFTAAAPANPGIDAPLPKPQEHGHQSVASSAVVEERSLVTSFAASGDLYADPPESIFLALDERNDPLGGGPADCGPLLLRSLDEREEFDAFRLFLRLSSAQVRQAEGVTLGQWRDSLEQPRNWTTTRRWIVERDGHPRGFASIIRRGGRSILTLLTDPRERSGGPLLIREAVSSVGRGTNLYCLIRSTQEELGLPLLDHGFKKAGDFSSYVRHVTVGVKERGLLPVGA